MGTGAALVGALRASRTVILPLLGGEHRHLGDANTALIIGIAGGGRLRAVLRQRPDHGPVRPALERRAVDDRAGPRAIVLRLHARPRPSARVWFVVVAIVLALANGIGSGILMTLGADLAPPDHPAPFLGAYRFTGDAGTAAAPLALSGLTAAASLSFAAGTIGVVGLLGAGLLFRWVPRFIDRGTRPFP